MSDDLDSILTGLICLHSMVMSNKSKLQGVRYFEELLDWFVDKVNAEEKVLRVFCCIMEIVYKIVK